jgi:hypothetical protein
VDAVAVFGCYFGDELAGLTVSEDEDAHVSSVVQVGLWCGRVSRVRICR